MNEAILNSLAGHILQALGPLPASRSHKQQMQQELLAHLLALYEEELAVVKDEQAAVRRAKQRFGRAEELGAELQTALPMLERLIFLLYRKGQIMWRWIWIVGCVAIMVGLGFVLPAIAQLRNADHIARSEAYPFAMCLALLGLGLVLSLGGVGTVAYSVVRAFRARSC
jgi:hypothetical protein